MKKSRHKKDTVAVFEDLKVFGGSDPFILYFFSLVDKLLKFSQNLPLTCHFLHFYSPEITFTSCLKQTFLKLTATNKDLVKS